MQLPAARRVQAEGGWQCRRLSICTIRQKKSWACGQAAADPLGMPPCYLASVLPILRVLKPAYCSPRSIQVRRPFGHRPVSHCLRYCCWDTGSLPAVLLGAFLANVTTAGSIATSGAIAVGNTLECLVGAWLITRWSGGTATFNTSGGVTRFALICLLVATPISALIGVGSLTIAGYTDPSRVTPCLDDLVAWRCIRSLGRHTRHHTMGGLGWIPTCY